MTRQVQVEPEGHGDKLLVKNVLQQIVESNLIGLSPAQVCAVMMRSTQKRSGAATRLLSAVTFLLSAVAASAGLPPPIPVPDSGSSVVLLALGCLGLIAAKRYIGGSK